MSRGEWYARVLIGAGQEYRTGLAMCRSERLVGLLLDRQKYRGLGRLGVDIMIRSASVLGYLTAAQKSGRQGT